MTEPTTRPQPGEEEESEGLMSSGSGPVENPNTAYNRIQTFSNTAIVLLGAAALIFCLKQLHQAFLLAMALVIIFGIGNLVLLGFAQRYEAQYAAARTAEANALAATAQAATAAAETARIAVAAMTGSPSGDPAYQTALERQRRQAAGS